MKYVVSPRHPRINQIKLKTINRKANKRGGVIIDVLPHGGREKEGPNTEAMRERKDVINGHNWSS